VVTTFGDFLRFYRLRAALTQEELAERTGVSVRAISDVERGRARTPQRRTVELLVAGLGLTGEDAAEFAGLARAGRRDRVAPAAGPPGFTGGQCALPPILIELTGREPEQRVLDACAAEADSSAVSQVLLVHGPPGAGKTALAVDAGHRLGARFAHGCLFLDLRGMSADPLTPARAVRALLRGLGVAERDIPAERPDRLALYRSLLRERSVLLVLDDAADEAQVRPLLAGGPGSLVVVTSRRALAGLAARRLSLELLGPAAAVALLGRIAGGDRVAAEPAAAQRVAELCGGIPLALLIAANRLASRPRWTIAHFAHQLDARHRRLSVLIAGDLQVRAAFDVSYRQLRPEVALVFRRLAVAPGAGTSAELVRVVTGLPAAEVAAALAELTDASLLRAGDEPGRHTCHELIRVFARELLEREEDAAGIARVTRRMHDWLLAVATKAALHFDHDRTEVAIAVDGPDPVPDRESAGRWLAAEEGAWREALRAAAGRGAHRQVLDLARAVHWYSDLRGTGGLWREVFQAGAEAARALGDRRAEAEQLNYLSWALYALCGRAREAFGAHERALAAAVGSGDTVTEAWAWYYRAGIERRLTTATAAVAHCRRAVALFEAAGHANGLHLALSLLGVMLHAAGEVAEAVAVHRRSVAHYRRADSQGRAGDAELLSMVLTRLATGLAASGDLPGALGLLAEAESRFARHGAPAGVSRVRYLRGLALAEAGHRDEARAELLCALGEERLSENRVEILSRLAGLSADPAEAREHRVRALAECARYDTPAVRSRAAGLAAALGVELPGPAPVPARSGSNG